MKHIFEDSSDLENLPFSLMTYLSYIFRLDASISTTIDDEKEGKNKFFNYFWGILLKFNEKVFEIHKHSWLSTTWILKKPSTQTLVEDIPEIKLSHWPLQSKTYKNSHWLWVPLQSLIALNKFYVLS